MASEWLQTQRKKLQPKKTQISYKKKDIKLFERKKKK
jgi:hypothetical protein